MTNRHQISFSCSFYLLWTLKFLRKSISWSLLWQYHPVKNYTILILINFKHLIKVEKFFLYTFELNEHNSNKENHIKLRPSPWCSSSSLSEKKKNLIKLNYVTHIHTHKREKSRYVDFKLLLRYLKYFIIFSQTEA